MISLIEANCKVMAGRATFRSSVAQDDGLPEGLPTGPGEQHVVRLHHVHHFLPGVEGDGGHPGDAEGQGGEDGVVEPVQAKVTLSASTPMGTDRPMGSHPSHTENTSSRRMASQNAGVLEMSRQQPRMSRSGQRPRKAPASTPRVSPKIAGQNPGEQEQSQGVAQPLPDDGQHRLAVEQGGAQVPVEGVGQPAQVPLRKGGVHPPVVLQLSDLFRDMVPRAAWPTLVWRGSRGRRT